MKYLQKGTLVVQIGIVILLVWEDEPCIKKDWLEHDV